MELPKAEGLARIRNDYPKTSVWIFAHIFWMAAAVIFYLVVTGVF